MTERRTIRIMRNCTGHVKNAIIQLYFCIRVHTSRLHKIVKKRAYFNKVR